MKYGFIGFGNMGKMLIHAFLKYSDIEPGDIYVSRNNKEKLHEINEQFPEVIVCDNNNEVVQNTDVLFLCVKPKNLKEVLKEIQRDFEGKKHLVSLVATAEIGALESLWPGKISKFIPALPSKVGVGVSLVCHNDKVSEQDATSLEKVLVSFSTIRYVEEADFSLATNLTSCMPGFIAAMFADFATAASTYPSSLNEEDIRNLLIETLYGTTLLMTEDKLDFSTVIAQVATKGGITESGIAVLDEHLPVIYSDLLKTTMEKWRKAAKDIAGELST